MDDFLATIEKNPALLTDYVAQPETWRKPAATSQSAKSLLEPAMPLSFLARKLQRLAVSNGSTVPGAATPSSDRLKLYQPAHQRYYLLSSSLVCGVNGLPDRKVDPGKEERVTFVIRRLFPPGGIDSDSGLARSRSGNLERARVCDDAKRRRLATRIFDVAGYS